MAAPEVDPTGFKRVPGQRVVPIGRDADGNPSEFLVGSEPALTNAELRAAPVPVAGSAPAGFDHLNTFTASVGTTIGGTEIVAERLGRGGAFLTNLGTATVYIGEGVITSVNAPLKPGYGKWYPVQGQIKGLSSSGSQNIAVEEVY